MKERTNHELTAIMINAPNNHDNHDIGKAQDHQPILTGEWNIKYSVFCCFKYKI